MEQNSCFPFDFFLNLIIIIAITAKIICLHLNYEFSRFKYVSYLSTSYMSPRTVPIASAS
jgi:hypothetical protein